MILDFLFFPQAFFRLLADQRRALRFGHEEDAYLAAELLLRDQDASLFQQFQQRQEEQNDLDQGERRLRQQIAERDARPSRRRGRSS